MGRAIVREPAVFLFDEPLSNLDAKLRVQMRLEIKALQTKLGVTSLYVTHDQVEAMTMADRMIVLNGGEAEQIGTPLEVYTQPSTLFAAQFIGSPAMNVVDAEIAGGKIMLGGKEVGSSDLADQPVKLGFRPEHMEPDDKKGSIQLQVLMSEPLGANTLLHGQLQPLGMDITASLPGVHPVEGTKVTDRRFSVAAENLHLFDPTTSRRLN